MTLDKTGRRLLTRSKSQWNSRTKPEPLARIGQTQGQKQNRRVANSRHGTSSLGWQGTGGSLVAPVAATQANLLRLQIPRAQLDLLPLCTMEITQLCSGNLLQAERKSKQWRNRDTWQRGTVPTYTIEIAMKLKTEAGATGADRTKVCKMTKPTFGASSS